MSTLSQSPSRQARATFDRDGRVPDRGPTSNLTIFIFFFAVALLIHKTQVSEGLSSIFSIATTALSVAVLFRPHSVRLAAALAIALLVEASWFAPFFFLAHMIYAAFVCIGILGAIGAMYGKEKRFAPSPSELEPYLFPLMRAAVYGMFGVVVLHKLNHGFFDPAVSCAVQHYDILQSRVPVVVGVGQLNGIPIEALLTIVTEGSIPILLFFKWTRLLGLFVAIGFHYVMAINGFQGFSGFALAMYVPFLPREFFTDVVDMFNRLSRPVWTVVRWGFPLGWALFAFGFTAAEYVGRTYQTRRLGYAIFLLLSPVIGLVFAWLVARRWSLPARPWPSERLTAAWQIVLVVLFLIHGLFPYLGLKTEAVLSIFSNLHTEQGRWNHLFMPESLRIASFQDSPVTVTAVENMTLLNTWERDFLQDRVRDADLFIVTQFEFKRQIAAHCRAGQHPKVSYVIDGKSFTEEDACQNPVLAAGNGWFLEKALWFRPVWDSNNTCLH